jgi:nucleoside-diphosphate-sugar epimerase
MTKVRTFVTGGSGMLGRRLIRELVASGRVVRALARSDTASKAVEAAGAEAVGGDLQDLPAVREGVRGCAEVIHCAAQSEQGGPTSDYLSNNVTATTDLLAIARDSGVSRFVHVGAAMCLLGGRPIVGADETWPLHQPRYSGYASSKTQADQAVRAANAPGFTTIVVRPGWIWGAPDDPQLVATVQAVRSRQMRLIDHGRHLMVTSHIDNVVDALILALTHGHGGSAYYVFDDGLITVHDFLSGLLQSQVLNLPEASIPAPIAQVIALLVDIVWRGTRRPGSPPLSRLLVTLNSRPFIVSDRLARTELGYLPSVSHAQGFSALLQAKSGESAVGPRGVDATKH